MANEQTEKRKTYSLDPERSLELARHALNMGEELGKSVARQSILDALVECLKDKTVFNKVRNIIKKNG